MEPIAYPSSTSFLAFYLRLCVLEERPCEVRVPSPLLKRPFLHYFKKVFKLFEVAAVNVEAVAYVDVPARHNLGAKAFGNLPCNCILEIREREYIHETCLVCVAGTPMRI